jgi:hypothetical protein
MLSTDDRVYVPVSPYGSMLNSMSDHSSTIICIDFSKLYSFVAASLI